MPLGTEPPDVDTAGLRLEETVKPPSDGAVGFVFRRRSVRQAAAPLLTSAALWVIVALFAADAMPILEHGVRQYDFSLYYVWSYALRHGTDPYATDLGPLGQRLGLHTGIFRHANYPASFVLLFEPLTLLSPQKAYWAWGFLNMVLLLGSLELLLGELRGAAWPWTPALWALALLYLPITLNFYLAQTQVLLLFLLAAALRCSERRRDIAAGCLVGFAGLLKVFPLATLAVFVLGRRWRTVAASAVTVVAGLLLTAALAGLGPTLGFFHGLSSVVDRQRSEFESARLISLNGFITRLLLSKPSAATGFFADRATQKLVVAAVSLVVVALSTLATWNPRSARELSAGFALWVVTAILVSPTAWHHYEVLLLVPFALALGDWLHAGNNARAAAALALASYVLTQATWFWSAFASPHVGGWLAPVLNEGFFLSLLLGYAAAFLLVRSARPAALPATPATAEPRLLLQETVAP
jgi:hypothetical protein